MSSEPLNSRSPSVLRRLWQQLSSMKFAITVLIVLAVASVLALFLGEFYPVRAGGPGWQEFWRQQLGLSRPLFNLFTFFELHDPFRSWWYQILLFLLSLSLFSCIIERLPIALRAMRLGAPRSSEEISGLRLFRTFTTRQSPEEVLKRLPPLFRFRKEQTGGEWRISGSHGSLSHLGPILAHSGLLCLAIGGLIASLMGFGTTLQGLPGDILKNPALGFDVRIDSFKIEYHPLGLGQYVLVDDSFIGKIVARRGNDHFLLETMSSGGQFHTLEVEKSRLRNQYDIHMDKGNIRDYISVLTVLEEGREVHHHRVEVNHPMRYKGFRFYQTSFDPDHPRVEAHIDSARIVVRRPGQTAGDTLCISPGETVALPDESELILARFLPDFRMDGKVPTSASADLRNPALQLEVRRNGEKLYHQWTFLRSAFHHASSDATFDFQALDIFGFKASETYPTILEVKKSPGTWLIWLGFLLATLGLFLAFYLLPQRIWLVVREKGGGRSEVFIGASCKKNPDLFSRKFEDWVTQIKGNSGETK